MRYALIGILLVLFLFGCSDKYYEMQKSPCAFNFSSKQYLAGIENAGFKR